MAGAMDVGTWGHTTISDGNVVSTEYPHSFLGSSMSVNPTGSLALLAGDKMIMLVDLDHTEDILTKFDRQSRYSVEETQFSFGQEALCAMAIHDRIEMVNFEEGRGIECTSILKGHTREVSDLSWHEQETELLASSSVDPYIYVWDIRTPRDPVITFASFTGSSQVCWERVSGHILASSHGGDIKLWDKRNTKFPVKYITAHSDGIHAMDFSSNRKGYLVSSGHDMAVRFWNIDENKAHLTAEREFVVSQAAIWKVRFTPFGEGLVTLMTTSLLRAETSLMLWNAQELSAPVHTFIGHSERVKEFCWRNPDAKRHRDHLQLVSWADDMTLKVWPIGDTIKRKCDNFINQFPNEDEVEQADVEHEMQEDVITNSSSVSPPSESIDNPQASIPTSSLDTLKVVEEEESKHARQVEQDSSERDSSLGDSISKSISFNLDTGSSMGNDDHLAMSIPTELIGGSHPKAEGLSPSASLGKLHHQSLEQEFRSINVGEALTLEQRNIRGRYCVFSGRTPKHKIFLHMSFPPDYPQKSPPRFTILKNSTFPQTRQDEIKARLVRVANQIVSKGNNCIDICLKQLEIFLYNLATQDTDEDDLDEDDQISPLGVLGERQDANVPYPRSSGARFCAVGKLVIFSVVAKDSNQMPLSLSAVTPTPKSLSVFSSQISSDSQNPSFKQSILRRTSQNRINSISSSISEEAKNVSEASDLSLVYIYDCHQMLPFSKSIAKKYSLLGSSISEICWANVSLTHSHLQSFVAETWALVAMLCLCEKSVQFEENLFPWFRAPVGQKMLKSRLNHHLKGFDLQTLATVAAVLTRRNSIKNPSDHHFIDPDQDGVMEAEVFGQPQLDTSCASNLIDPDSKFSMEVAKKQYAELLRRSGYWAKGAEMNKLMKVSREERKEFQISVKIENLCDNCNKLKGRNKFLTLCRKCRGQNSQREQPQVCMICKIRVRGVLTLCLDCGHGGHLIHLHQWFKQRPVCPQWDCNCQCLSIFSASQDNLD